jgi:hypothetical protein
MRVNVQMFGAEPVERFRIMRCADPRESLFRT